MTPPRAEAGEAAEIRGRESASVIYRRSARARRYRLTLRRDGTAVATIPLRGSLREAKRFVARHAAWLERARRRQSARPRAPASWHAGTRVLWRGNWAEILLPDPIARPANRIRVVLGSEVFTVSAANGDLRPGLEDHFLRRAKVELPARTWELAARVAVELVRVTVRNQRSLWGSCSASGTVSLNWRLVQGPEFVRDYIIYHELMHLREMNHSARFWARVEEVCPGWREAEHWIRRHGSLLGL